MNIVFTYVCINMTLLHNTCPSSRIFTFPVTPYFSENVFKRMGHTTGQRAESETLGLSVVNGMSSSDPSPQGSENLTGKLKSQQNSSHQSLGRYESSLCCSFGDFGPKFYGFLGCDSASPSIRFVSSIVATSLCSVVCTAIGITWRASPFQTRGSLSSCIPRPL